VLEHGVENEDMESYHNFEQKEKDDRDESEKLHKISDDLGSGYRQEEFESPTGKSGEEQMESMMSSCPPEGGDTDSFDNNSIQMGGTCLLSLTPTSIECLHSDNQNSSLVVKNVKNLQNQQNKVQQQCMMGKYSSIYFIPGFLGFFSLEK